MYRLPSRAPRSTFSLALLLLLIALAPARAALSPEAARKLDPLSRIRAVSAAAPDALARAPSARLAGADADLFVSGIAEWRGDRAALEALGARVGTRAGNLYTLRVPPSAMTRLLEDPRLARFEGSRRLEPQLHDSGIAIGSPGLHAPAAGFPAGVRGQA